MTAIDDDVQALFAEAAAAAGDDDDDEERCDCDEAQGLLHDE